MKLYPFPAFPGGPVSHQSLYYAFLADLHELPICPGPRPPETEHFRQTIEVEQLFRLLDRYRELEWRMLNNATETALRKPIGREVEAILAKKFA
jgi:hypothetical protein